MRTEAIDLWAPAPVNTVKTNMANPLLRKITRSSEKGLRPERLIVFHHAGGNGNLYLPHLRNETRPQEIWILDLPGRGFRSNEAPIENFTELRNRLLEELSALSDLPLSLFGHSMGALVAHDLAAQLERRSPGSVKRLGVSGLLAPTQRNIRGRIGLADLSDDDFLAEFEIYAEIPKEIKTHQALFSLFLKSARADIRLMESYPTQSETMHFVETFVFGGEQDRSVPVGDLERWHSICFNAKDPFILPGGHFFLFENFDKVLNTFLEN
jgi:surfactin synthase thioesterase subunit